MTSHSKLDEILVELRAIRKCLEPKQKAKAKPAVKIVDTWTAYARAMTKRYKVAPTRNASVNGILAHFVNRVGMSKSPSIATFYVEHQSYWYAKNGHPVGLMLKDAEKLAMEWESGNVITNQQAKAGERQTSNVNVFKRIVNDTK